MHTRDDQVKHAPKAISNTIAAFSPTIEISLLIIVQDIIDINVIKSSYDIKVSLCVPIS